MVVFTLLCQLKHLALKLQGTSARPTLYGAKRAKAIKGIRCWCSRLWRGGGHSALCKLPCSPVCSLITGGGIPAAAPCLRLPAWAGVLLSIVLRAFNLVFVLVILIIFLILVVILALQQTLALLTC